MEANGREHTEFNSWDEAFRALSAPVQQQSVRVADYTRVIFLAACDKPFAKQNAKSKAEITEQLADVAYRCGLLHQIGKALGAPEYQVWNSAFTKTQVNNYRKYPAAGEEFSRVIQQKLENAYLPADASELELACRMVQETCSQHMERWNGSGYPNGILGKSISPIAQVVGIAKELDRLATETKDEEPFDKALAAINADSGTLWNPSLVNIVNLCADDCRKVHQKYIYYSLALPQTIHLLEKRDNRPMGLKYRPLVSDLGGTVAAYEATPWYEIVMNENKQDGSSTVDEMLTRTGLNERMGTYFLYEAADTLYRIRNCRLELKALLLNMPRDFFGNTSQLKLFNQLFTDQPVPRGMLLLTVPADSLIGCTKGREENLKRLLRNEVELVLDDYDPAKISRDVLEDFGFAYVRLAPELNGKPETAAALSELIDLNFKVIGRNADTKHELAWQVKNGFAFCGGMFTGAPVDEDELIRDSLLREVTA